MIIDSDYRFDSNVKKTPAEFYAFYRQEMQLAQLDVNREGLATLVQKRGRWVEQRIRFKRWHTSKLRCFIVSMWKCK